MIIKILHEDIFASSYTDIAFGLNIEGINNFGVASAIGQRYIPELFRSGPQEMGTVLTFENGGRKFHGLVCSSMQSWSETPSALLKCLNKVQLKGDVLAIVPIGTGLIGYMSHADVSANLQAIHASSVNCAVYSLDFSVEQIKIVGGINI
jgi:hypothetical protein